MPTDLDDAVTCDGCHTLCDPRDCDSCARCGTDYCRDGCAAAQRHDAEQARRNVKNSAASGDGENSSDDDADRLLRECCRCTRHAEWRQPTQRELIDYLLGAAKMSIADAECACVATLCSER